MEIKTNISKKFNDTKIIINAPELTEELENIIQYISNINQMPNQIIANKNNEIYFIDLKNIISFFSKDKYIYAKTKEDNYRIKYKLYELEKLLSKDFIRISNSCIINVEQIECFDTSIIGTVLVKLKDGTIENVSKRKISSIMKFLRQRGNLKWKILL